MSGSVKRIAGGVLAVVLAVLFLPNMCNSQVRSASRKYDQQQYVKPNEALIRAGVMDYLAQQGDRACLKTAFIPFDSAKDASPCEHCETLADAGLLQKSVHTVNESGRPRASVRFELTARGQPLYRQNIGDRRGTPGFCFGKTVLDHLDFVLVRQGALEIRVTAHSHVEDADQLLFSARADDLGLPRLKRFAFNRSKLPPVHLVARLGGDGVYQSITRE